MGRGGRWGEGVMVVVDEERETERDLLRQPIEKRQRSRENTPFWEVSASTILGLGQKGISTSSHHHHARAQAVLLHAYVIQVGAFFQSREALLSGPEATMLDSNNTSDANHGCCIGCL